MIEEILDEYLDMAKGIMQEGYEPASMVAFLLREGRIVEVVCKSREAIKKAIEIGKSLETRWICVVFTGWMKEYEKAVNYKYGDVGRSPDKKEVLVGQIADNKGNKISRVFVIRRGEDSVEFEEIKGFTDLGGYLSV